MGVIQILLVISTVIFLSVGQVLFKLSALKVKTSGDAFLPSPILDPKFIMALFVYGIATLMWVYVLQFAPLREAYPYAALAFIFVPLLSYLFLGESLQISSFIGALVIIAGVYIASR